MIFTAGTKLVHVYESKKDGQGIKTLDSDAF